MSAVAKEGLVGFGARGGAEKESEAGVVPVRAGPRGARTLVRERTRA